MKHPARNLLLYLTLANSLQILKGLRLILRLRSLDQYTAIRKSSPVILHKPVPVNLSLSQREMLILFQIIIIDVQMLYIRCQLSDPMCNITAIYRCMCIIQAHTVILIHLQLLRYPCQDPRIGIKHILQINLNLRILLQQRLHIGNGPFHNLILINLTTDHRIPVRMEYYTLHMQLSRNLHALMHPQVRYLTDFCIVAEHRHIKKCPMHRTTFRKPGLQIPIDHRLLPFLIIQQLRIKEIIDLESHIIFFCKLQMFRQTFHSGYN